jgi:polyisoprenoid-binding protein YceI
VLLPMLVVLLVLVACERKPKRVVRTEPWPAPLASAGPTPSASPSGASIRYRIERAEIRLELPARRAKPRGAIATVSGTIDLDPAQLEKTRARLEADLLSLSFENQDGEADAARLARALTWLELNPEREADARPAERYAVLEITALERSEPPIDGVPTGRANVTAHAELTLHRFRVPVTLELEVKLEQSDAGSTDILSIRTLRPLVVSLAAHDILPRDARGNVLSDELASAFTEVGREARVSAKLVARPEGR